MEYLGGWTRMRKFQPCGNLMKKITGRDDQACDLLYALVTFANINLDFSPSFSRSTRASPIPLIDELLLLSIEIDIMSQRDPWYTQGNGPYLNHHQQHAPSQNNQNAAPVDGLNVQSGLGLLAVYPPASATPTHHGMSLCPYDGH